MQPPANCCHPQTMGSPGMTPMPNMTDTAGTTGYGGGGRYGWYGYDDRGFPSDRGRGWHLDPYGYRGYPRDRYGRYQTRRYSLYFDSDWDDDDWEDYWEDYWDD